MAASLSGTASAAPPVAGIVGWGYSTVQGCPYIEWRLAKHPDGQVTGIAYYSDMSGTSQVSGTFSDSGQIHLTLTSAMGNGPVGTVTGEKQASGAANANTDRYWLPQYAHDNEAGSGYTNVSRIEQIARMVQWAPA